MPIGRSTRRASLTAYVGIGILAALVTAFQLDQLGRTPLEAWDESRLAVNAIEMLISGERLVTTYAGHADLWNTKPPLAINLMAWSMQLLGPTAFAVRLPAALASCATVILVAFFVNRVTRSLYCGLAAGALLASGPSFNGYHSGQTGDYDAILTFFTTAYGAAVFELVERGRRAPMLALGAGGLVGLAILTKGIAGVIPGIGMALFALTFAVRALQAKFLDYLVVAATAAVIAAIYYLTRNAAGDGYLAAVAYNELGGRYSTALEQHSGSKWFYLSEFKKYLPGRLLPAVLMLPLTGPGTSRRLAVFSLFQVAGLVLVYSSAATKFSWYLVPALPFVAIAVAVAGLALAQAAQRLPRWVATAIHVALCAAVLSAMANAVLQRYVHPIIPATQSRAFDALIAAAVARGTLPLVVVDTGFPNNAGFVAYSPTLRFYTLAAAQRNVRIVQVRALAMLGSARNVGSCDPQVSHEVAAAGRLVWAGKGCVLATR